MTKWRAFILAASLAGLLGHPGCGFLPEAAVSWIDLAAEHALAEAYFAPRYRLDGSDPADQSYLDHRWRGAKPNEKGLLSAGDTAAFKLPLVSMPVVASLDLEPNWDSRADRREVTLRMNGTPLLSVTAATTSHQRFDIAPEVVRTGTNELEIECSGARSFQVLQLLVHPDPGGTTGRDLAKGSWVESADHGPRIMQIPGAQLSYYLRPPAEARLRFHLPTTDGSAVIYTVTLQRMRSDPEVVFSGRSGDGEVEVPLVASDGTPLRIAFDVQGAMAAEDRGSIAYPWEAPRIVLPPDDERTRRVSKAADEPRRARELPNIVLYVIDALRADHLETYGYYRRTSPEIASFARDAIVFEHAYAQSVWTRPTVGSLMTGLFPNQHLAVNDVGYLSESVKLLSSYLGEIGYTCIGLQSNANAGRHFGFDRGFDVFVGPARPGPPPPDAASSPGSRTVREEDLARRSAPQPRSSERTLRTLVGMADGLKEPFFLFIQTVDPHDPYDPPEGFRDLATGHTIPGLSGKEALTRLLTLPGDKIRSRQARRLRKHLRALYDCEIRHNDYYFGQTLEFLRHRGLYDNTVVVLTADHGEAFREHGYDVYHSAFYENTIRVPLILKPPTSRGEVRVDEPVQHIDLVPTLLEMVGLDSPGLPGRSLLASAHTEDEALPTTVHALRFRDVEIPRYKREGRAVISWPWKLIRNDVWTPHHEIYNLEKDPRERRNLWRGVDPVLLGFLRQETRRLPLDLDNVYGRRGDMTPEAEEALRALGYVE
jgi:arylsulfatase